MDPWKEEEHVQRLQQRCAGTFTLDTNARRGLERQYQQRAWEQQLRSRVVDLAEVIREQGWTIEQTADFLHLSPRTLRDWQARYCVSAPMILPLGRPTLRSSRDDRNAVLAVLDELGPATGVPTLQTCFPEMPRAELTDLLWRYRRVWRYRHHYAPRILRWQTPGTVWAADYSEAPELIDGLYPYLLAVRDLASGLQLLWLPVEAANAATVVEALHWLFARHGAPLVLKTDNGSPFGAGETLGYLGASGVIPLFSPPHTPRYNGSIETSIGSMKIRTERQAARADHPGYWTMSDVSAAQAEANATSRPQGGTGPTAEQLWQARTPPTVAQRSDFETTVARYREEIRTREVVQEEPMSTRKERLMDREAVRRALGDHGYLLFSRRRIPLPFNQQKVAEIR